MSRRRFVYSLLKDICDKHNVTLLEDYSEKFLTRDTRIIGKCKFCENNFDKSFNEIDRNNNFACKDCAKKNGFSKGKKTMIEKYGVEYAAQSETFRNKMKETCLKNYGVEHALHSQEIKDKIKQTNNERYGCDYGLQNEDVKNKRVQTNIEKYGVANQLQRTEILDKIKQTNNEKYGCDYTIQNEEIKAKIKQTNNEKYGCDYGFQNEEIKDKIQQTNFKKYGVKHNLQRKEIKDKIKQTCLEKYGVEFAMQCPEIMENNIKSSYYLKEYKLPSGNIIKIQGYEHFALDELLKKENFNETEIITGSANVPEIWYNDNNGKKHRHFVDIFIPSLNKCIEVKSTWTFETQKNIIFLKQNAAKELGYLYEIWIYNGIGGKNILM